MRSTFLFQQGGFYYDSLQISTAAIAVKAEVCTILYKVFCYIYCLHGTSYVIMSQAFIETYNCQSSMTQVENKHSRNMPAGILYVRKKKAIVN